MSKEISIMAYSTVTSKGQVTIPKAVRKRMGIDEGSRLLFVDDGDRILVYKVEGGLEDLYGMVEHTGPPIDFRRMKEEIAAEIAKEAMAGIEGSGDKPKKMARKVVESHPEKPRKAAAKQDKKRVTSLSKKIP
jgi:antitoxin PrlF